MAMAYKSILPTGMKKKKKLKNTKWERTGSALNKLWETFPYKP